MNLKNNDEKCFQYAITVVLNHEEIINMIGKSLKQTMNQILLMCYIYLIILKK